MFSVDSCGDFFNTAANPALEVRACQTAAVLSGRNAAGLVYSDDSAGLCPDLPDGAVLTESGSSCYIYKVPRVQFILFVFIFNFFLFEYFF